ncbi:MAG: transposase [Muribaculaceae bacterium]|nr:transposase [Muribaculaceae bacterium]
MNKFAILTQRQERWIGKFAGRNEIKLNMRILRGILSLLRTSCQWRLLPSEFGHWKSVYHHFRSWSERCWLKK